MSKDFSIKSVFRTYSVHFVEDYSVELEKLLDSNNKFIIDEKIYDLYLKNFHSKLTEKNCIILQAAEENKTLSMSTNVIDWLIKNEFKKNYKLVAIGGGIIQDITSFTASILYRGISWVFLPTTLLAQADSCIGSKTSINFQNNKNLIGGFHPPEKIYIDTVFLDSLSESDIKSGIGEMLHFYYYSNSPLTSSLFNQYEKILKNRKLLTKYTNESLKIKKAVIQKDEFDKNERNKFNYGHTFGHALETITNYAIPHGQAVTIGMDLANYLSWKFGYVKEKYYRINHNLLKKNFPEFDKIHFILGDYLAALSKDKKNTGNDIVCILTKGPGKLIKEKIVIEPKFLKFLEKYFNREIFS